MSRLKTGLARPKPIGVGLNETEKELLARDAFDRKKSQAELLRSGYFRNGWEKRLMDLRIKQRNLPVDNFLK